MIGNLQCDSLGSEIIQTYTGQSTFDPESLLRILTIVTVLEKQWCREMKVIQAFSWMNFVLYAFALIILIVLVSRAQAFGRHNIWREPIRGAASAFVLTEIPCSI